MKVLFKNRFYIKTMKEETMDEKKVIEYIKIKTVEYDGCQINDEVITLSYNVEYLDGSIDKIVYTIPHGFNGNRLPTVDTAPSFNINNYLQSDVIFQQGFIEARWRETGEQIAIDISNVKPPTPIEITFEEAMKSLEEKYGRQVKIVTSKELGND